MMLVLVLVLVATTIVSMMLFGLRPILGVN